MNREQHINHGAKLLMQRLAEHGLVGSPPPYIRPMAAEAVQESMKEVLRQIFNIAWPELAPTQDEVRVLRIIEYVGPRSIVEEQVKHSVHGTRELNGHLRITATTLGEFPEILRRTDPKPMFPVTTYEERDENAVNHPTEPEGT